MPIYAYKCDSCGHAQDVLQKISDPLLTVCPACGAQTYTKQLTAAGFQLKGSGWYATDFKGGSAPSAASESAEASSKEGKPEASSLVKTEAANSDVGKTEPVKTAPVTSAPATPSTSSVS